MIDYKELERWLIDKIEETTLFDLGLELTPLAYGALTTFRLVLAKIDHMNLCNQADADINQSQADVSSCQHEHDGRLHAMPAMAKYKCEKCGEFYK